MGIKELINKIRDLGQHDAHWEIPDDVTTDKSLRSLRRRRREQLEEIEKIKLKKAIAEYEQYKTRRDMYGTEGYRLLGNNKKKAIIKQQKSTYLGRYKL